VEYLRGLFFEIPGIVTARKAEFKVKNSFRSFLLCQQCALHIQTSLSIEEELSH